MNELKDLNTKISIDFTHINDEILFPKLPKSGPLTKYRQMATFDWRKMSLILEAEDSIRFKNKIWNFLGTHPEFARSSTSLTMDEQRRQATRRQYVIYNEKLYTFNDYIECPHLSTTYILSLMAFEPCFAVKSLLSFGMFPSVLSTTGTDRLMSTIADCHNAQISGSFALTEISHGTNALRMRTTATYDSATEEFILNSPDFEAAKCWIGNLGKTCTHSIVYAQLYTPDGKHHGLNAFLVQVRDTKTLKAMPGCLVGDLGEKIGLTGVDNGFIMFDNYRIPRINLLARNGDVKPDGKYVSPIKDKKSRLGASFGALSGGRVNICGIGTTYMIKAITIAVRYSAARLQFGPENSDQEFPVLEYQSQQYRLIPHLATTYLQKIFSSWISLQHIQMMIGSMSGENVSGIGMEIHALSSAAKPVCTWAARDAIQECREACGGHGYLKVTGIGDLRNDNDANCTYEGENNVLIQQASNWLLGIRKQGYEQFAESSPLGSATFLKNFNKLIQTKMSFNTTSDAMNPNNLSIALDWLCAWLLEKTGKRLEQLQKQEGKSMFDARNDMQVFYAATLSVVYAQRTIYDVFFKHISRIADCQTECGILFKLLSLYGANLLIKYSGLLYEGGLLSDSKSSELLKLGIIELLPVLKNEVISLVDAIAPPDFVINSPLGMSDGQVYKHLQSALMENPSVFERPNWWKDAVHWQSYVIDTKSKL